MSIGIIDINHFSKFEIKQILKLMEMLKKADYEKSVPELLKNCNLAMIFEEPSTRTRISFESAMTKLGGKAQYLKPGEIHLGDRECLYDTIKVLSRLTDGILCRALKHETILGIFKYSDVPVFNGLSDLNHPTQVLGDFLTIKENFKSKNTKWSEITLGFIGDSTNVCRSLMMISSKLNVTFIQVAPKKYLAPNSWIEKANQNYKLNGSKKVILTSDVAKLKGVDFLYTDLWWWVDQTSEASERYKSFINGNYQVDLKLLKLIGKQVKVMHCLPCARNVELVDEVFDGKQSIIFDQSENKLYSAMGVLSYFMSELKTLDDKNNNKNKYKKLILDFFNYLKKEKVKDKNWTYNNDYQFKIEYLKDVVKNNKNGDK